MITFVDATTSQHARGIGTVINSLTNEMSGDGRVIIARGPGIRSTVGGRHVQIARTRIGRLGYQRLLLPLDVADLKRKGSPIGRVLLLDAYIPSPFVRR